MRAANQQGWRFARIVFRKEMRETLRDTRTLVIMVIVPVLLYPALLILAQQLALFGQRQLEREPSTVAVTGEADSLFLGFLAAREGVVLREVEDPEQAVRSDLVSAVAVFSDEIGTDGNQSVLLLFDAANDQSRRGRGVLSDALGVWRDSLLVQRISEQGLPPGFARPLIVTDSSVARPEELGGYALGRFLPMLLVVMTMLGTFYPAIDLAAGEKERGTLETLLTAPIPSGQVVAGKFLAVTVVGLVSAGLNLGSMLLTFQTGLFQLTQAFQVEFSLPVGSILVIFGALFPLAVLFGALFLGIAVRSRSFKEAQNALTPVYMAVILPALLPLFPGIDMTPALAVIPVAGVSLLFRELMAGSGTLFLGSLAILSTLVYASAALVFAADAFGREEVLFGDGGSSEVGNRGLGFLRGMLNKEPDQAEPGFTPTLFLIAGVGVLYFYLAGRLQAGFGETGLLFSQIGLLFLPAILFLRAGGYKTSRTLSLRAPSGRGLLAGLLIIAGGTPLVWFLTWLQGFILPMPQEFLEGMAEFLLAESPGRVFWLLILVALTPAVCEEALFRGVLLAGTRRRMAPLGVVLLNGVVFGAFHIPAATVYRFLPSATLGVLLAWVVLRTRSIWPGVLMHFVNNGSIVILASSPWILERFADPERGPPLWLLLPAVLSLLAGAILLEGRGRGEERSEGPTGSSMSSRNPEEG
ncbi:MAG: CPBP family intramembrane metalloprotease [Gemmatimonadetes bacterium]|nr:CPBP family intramembrane metalloprotease [Gemmatimonadota bacterium]